MNPESSKTKRCLFGRPDHQQLEADLKKELNKDVQEMNEKYNFDFPRGEPLEGGRFEWEAVEPSKQEQQTTGASCGSRETKSQEIETEKSSEKPTEGFKTPAKTFP